jgi:hypothetical protein
MPIWLLFVLTSLGVYRATRLAVKDDFPPVLWVRDRLAGGWRPLTTAEREHAWPDTPDYQEINGVRSRYLHRARWSPAWLGDLVSCPWCASGWLSGAAVLVLDLVQSIPDPVVFGGAVWGASALLASRSWA